MTATNPSENLRQIVLQRIFLKDTSLEVPHAPQIFARPWTPEVDVQMSTGVNGTEPDTYQVVLSITVTAKLGNDVAFLVEVHQAGIFTAKGFSQQELQGVLATYCPHTLFPFAREAVSGLVMRAGFPPLVLQPVNFEALYAEHLLRARNEAVGTPAAGGGANTVLQ
jgi:preprotein translocase subunit SecB